LPIQELRIIIVYGYIFLWFFPSWEMIMTCWYLVSNRDPVKNMVTCKLPEPKISVYNGFLLGPDVGENILALHQIWCSLICSYYSYWIEDQTCDFRCLFALFSSTIRYITLIVQEERKLNGNIIFQGHWYNKCLTLLSAVQVKLLSRHIGKPMEEIAQDIRRPKYFSPSEAVDYGIIDKVRSPLWAKLNLFNINSSP
jgi:hypothetical protein